MRFGEYPPQGSAICDDEPDAGTPDGISDNHLSRPGERWAEADPEKEAAALAALGFSKPLIARLREQALRHGTSIEPELLRSGKVGDEA
ncbi:hypothetical protein [Aliirhizobium smilacinae]|uniref:Uncharacterized protein n=1 Tax=Aliirhizobium smilacinae TaxID=1395944 RepID=A0A5C4XSD4_9HYPH|nr:hypothetical protein [Rhizobium smilacinae]TNM66213.1 hypothetical protein FHP24_08410 [Rhizobium smilacinae]